MTIIVACIVTAGLIWLAIDQLFSFLGGLKVSYVHPCYLLLHFGLYHFIIAIR
jgi:hypothetical protein